MRWAILLLAFVACVGCERVVGVRRSARVERAVDLGCVMSVLESTPGISDVHFGVLRDVDDAETIVHAFDVAYAGTRGALQVVNVRGTGQVVQQMVLRARGGVDQAAADRVRPVMQRVERRLASLCRVRWAEDISERCSAVACPVIDDLPTAPPPGSVRFPAQTHLDLA